MFNDPVTASANYCFWNCVPHTWNWTGLNR